MKYEVYKEYPVIWINMVSYYRNSGRLKSKILRKSRVNEKIFKDIKLKNFLVSFITLSIRLFLVFLDGKFLVIVKK